MTTAAVSAMIVALGIAIIGLGVWIDIGIRIASWAFPSARIGLLFVASIMLWPIVLVGAGLYKLGKRSATAWKSRGSSR